MRLFALRFGRVWRKPVNHADVMVEGVCCGAQFPVSIARPFEEYYNDGKERTLFIYKIEPQIDLTSCKLMLAFNGAGLPYDTRNFIDFIVKLITGKWHGHTGHFAEKKVYCIELAHMLMRKMQCKKLMDDTDYDDDPEQSRQWAIENLEFVGQYEL